jgi:hypothetical protein
MQHATRAVAIVLAALAARAATAQTFNLTSDFSETANPNWTWTFVRGGTPLVKVMPSLPNALNAVTPSGIWSTSPTSNFESSVFRVTGDGSSVGYTNNDFLAGDVLVHGTNPGGPDLEVRWGGNVAGTATVTGKVWYAHSPVNRVGLYEFRHGATLLAAGNMNSANHRGNPLIFSGGGTLTIAPGDTLRLAIKPLPGQTFASIAGADLTVVFSPRACAADLTYGAIPGQPGYAMKNGIADNDDFFYYLAQFAAGNIAVADLTTGAIPAQPGYGVPNGVLNNDDFFYYLAIFAAGC